MQFVATLERRRRGSMYSSRAWPSAGRLRDTPFHSCRLFQDYLLRERESVIALLGDTGRAARPDSRRWPNWAQAQLTQDSIPCGTVSMWDSLPCGTVPMRDSPVSSGWLEAFVSHTPGCLPLHTGPHVCMRTRRGGALCMKILEGSAESSAESSLPWLSVEVEALPEGAQSASVPGVILQLPPYSQKVRNNQGKQWRQGSLPLTSKKMYWPGCFHKVLGWVFSMHFQ